MKRLISVLCGCVLTANLTVSAFAVDNYSFSTQNGEEFVQTGIQTVTYDGAIPGYVQEIYDISPKTAYDSRFGATIITPELDGYGGRAAELITNSEKLIIEDARGAPAETTYPEATATQTVQQYALTPVEDVRKPDGSIGTLKIPAIGLTVTAYDGEVTAAMKKGIGHIDSTSAWSGNCGLVGHNRGTSNHFGKLKALKTGDEITYTTTLGARTYTVTTVQKIANNDWSYLQYTSDNRITLLTCVEDQPEYRLLVQGVLKAG